MLYLVAIEEWHYRIKASSPAVAVGRAVAAEDHRRRQLKAPSLNRLLKAGTIRLWVTRITEETKG